MTKETAQAKLKALIKEIRHEGFTILHSVLVGDGDEERYEYFEIHDEDVDVLSEPMMEDR